MVPVLLVQELDTPGSVIGCRDWGRGRGAATTGQPSVCSLLHQLVFPWWVQRWATGFRFDSALLRCRLPVHGDGFTGQQRGAANGPSCCSSTAVTAQRTGYPAVRFSLFSNPSGSIKRSSARYPCHARPWPSCCDGPECLTARLCWWAARPRRDSALPLVLPWPCDCTARGVKAAHCWLSPCAVQVH